jgi:integrase
LRDEARRLLDALEGTARRIALLRYRSRLRLNGCRQLRVNDVDLNRRHVMGRSGEGAKPDQLRPELGAKG